MIFFMYSSGILCKKIFISNEWAILCKPSFELMRKWCKISCKHAKLLRKRIFCFVETLTRNYSLKYQRSTISEISEVYDIENMRGLRYRKYQRSTISEIRICLKKLKAFENDLKWSLSVKKAKIVKRKECAKRPENPS